MAAHLLGKSKDERRSADEIDEPGHAAGRVVNEIDRPGCDSSGGPPAMLFDGGCNHASLHLQRSR